MVNEMTHHIFDPLLLNWNEGRCYRYRIAVVGGNGALHMHFQQYFSYIVAVSFIGGGNR
jgi:hypothetical protein